MQIVRLPAMSDHRDRSTRRAGASSFVPEIFTGRRSGRRGATSDETFRRLRHSIETPAELDVQGAEVKPLVHPKLQLRMRRAGREPRLGRADLEETDYPRRGSFDWLQSQRAGCRSRAEERQAPAHWCRSARSFGKRMRWGFWQPCQELRIRNRRLHRLGSLRRFELYRRGRGAAQRCFWCLPGTGLRPWLHGAEAVHHSKRNLQPELLARERAATESLPGLLERIADLR